MNSVCVYQIHKRGFLLLVSAAIVTFASAGASALNQDPYSGDTPADTAYSGDPKPAEVPGEAAVDPAAQKPVDAAVGNDAASSSGDPVYDQKVEDVAGQPPEKAKSKFDAGNSKLKPFQGSQLMVGRNVKMPKKSRKFEIGLNLNVAPLNVVANRARDEIVTQTVDQMCASTPDPVACKAQVEPMVTEVMTTLESVSPEQWDTIRAAAGGDAAALDKALEDAGITDAGARAQVAGYVTEYAGEAGTAEQRMQAVDAVRAVSTSSAISLMFEPYFAMNFKYLELAFYFPFAVQIEDGAGTKIEMANVSLDAKSGWDWTFGKVVSLGIAGGIQLYFPTGTAGIERSTNSDIFASPKFMRQYMTWAPYLVLGMDLAQFVQLQGHLEFVSMHGVRGAPALSTIQYLKYGGGLIILPKFLFSILVEFNGCYGLNNAANFDAVFLTGGFQFKIAFFKLSLAVQLPLVDRGHALWDSNYWSNASYDQLSRFTFMSRVAFTF
jgi:hypothetical protein